MKEQLPNIEAFSLALLNTEDLDPVYCMLWRAGLEPELLNRWLLAYFWFYHAGVASQIAESSDFFHTALWAFDNKWPRGAERRHFRTSQARDSILWFKHTYGTAANAIEALGDGTFTQVASRVRAWPMFGPWITFKVADMLERVLARSVSFIDCRLDGVYEEPVEGAKIAAREWGRPGLSFSDTVQLLLHAIGSRKAPPRYDRALNIQEIETCFCKFKSHRRGHYAVGKDTKEIFHGLTGRGPLATRLQGALMCKKSS